MSDPLVEPPPEPAPLALAVTQIAVAAGDPNVLYALAADGSVWRMAVMMGYLEWYRLPDLPAAGAGSGRSAPA